jgi:tol-pal system protein YbgF
LKLTAYLLFTVSLAASALQPVTAQEVDPVRLDKRVGTLESQMRAVQRKVFPGGDPKLFAPEIAPAAPAPVEPAGIPASNPVNDLAARVDALEAQLRTLTGQIETLQFRQRQIDEAQAKLRGDVEFRLTALEQGHAAAAPAAGAAIAADAAAKPGKPAPTPEAPAKPKTESAAWKAAYANVTAKDWAAAAPAMEAFLADWPKAAKAPEAQYWLGRANAEQAKPAEAARAYLDGYKNYPKSDRAADSLIGLAKAMQALKKPKDSCRVLGELDQYGDKLTGGQKSEAKALSAKAKCEA